MATPPAAEHRDLEARFRKIERLVSAVQAAVARRPKFEVSAGDLTISGGDLVVDGGDFLLLDTDGSTVFRLGPQFFGDRGVTINREDGTQALAMAQPFDGYDGQIITLQDRHGNVILQESPFGEGHDAPFLPLPFQPVTPATAAASTGPHGLEVSNASGTFTDVFRWRGARHNPWLRFLFRVKCSDATTAAEVRVVDKATGTALSPFLGSPWTGTRAAGSTTYVSVDPGAGLGAPGNPGDTVELAVQVRRSAGAGTVVVAVDTATGGPV